MTASRSLSVTSVLVSLLVLAACGSSGARVRGHIITADVYGMRKAPRATIEALIGTAMLPEFDEKKVRERLLESSSVANVRFHYEPIGDDELALFVGIEEPGREPRPALRAAPAGNLALPARFRANYAALEAARRSALIAGVGDGDFRPGHARASDADTRALEIEMRALANTHAPLVRRVLREASNAGDRAIAALALPYITNKRSIIADLVRATSDTDPNVRANAARGLAGLAELSRALGSSDAAIPLQPLLDLLRSATWTDRTYAVRALLELTKTRDPVLLATLRSACRAELLEMANWHSERHARPAFLLLARVEGLTDNVALDHWNDDRKEWLTKVAARSE